MSKNENTENIDNLETTPETEPALKGRKNSFFRKVRKFIFRTIGIIIALLLLISISFILLSQTKGFRQWFSGFVLDIVNNELDARISVSDIIIQPFRGIEVDDLRIITAGDTLAYIPKLHIKYAASMLLKETIRLHKIEIDNPSVKLIRNPIDSSWNFEHIAKPKKDKSKASPFEWLIDLHRLNLNNGKLVVSDRLNLVEGKFSPTNISLSNLNIDLSGKAELKKKEIEVKLHKISFVESSSELNVDNLSLVANANTNGIVLKFLNLNSNLLNLYTSIELNKFDIFKATADTLFENADFKINLAAKNIELKKVSKLVNLTPELTHDIDLNIKASGKLNNISLDLAEVAHEKTLIRFGGRVKNVTESSKMTYKVNFKESVIHEKDVHDFVSQLVKDLPEYRKMDIKKLDLSGDNNSVDMDLSINTGIGDLSGKANLKFKEIPEYQADFNFDDINLGNLLKDNSLLSRFKGNVSVKGKGTKDSELEAEVALKLDNSHFTTYQINSLNGRFRINPKLDIDIDTLAINLVNVNPDSIRFAEPVSRIFINGKLNLGNKAKPAYDLGLSIKGADLAYLLGNKEAPRIVDANFKIKGEGINPDSINAKLKLDLEQCSFTDRALFPTNIEIVLDRFEGKGRYLQIASDIINLELVGDYNISDFGTMVENQVPQFASYISEKVGVFYDTTGKRVRNVIFWDKNDKIKPYTMNLKGEIKDLSALDILLPDSKVSANATLDLDIETFSNRTIFKIRDINVSYFNYADSQTVITLNPMKVMGELDMQHEADSTRINKIFVMVDSPSENYINGLTFKKPYIKSTYQEDYLDIAINGAINNSIDLEMAGRGQFHADTMDMTIHKALFDFKNSFKWENAELLKFRLTQNGVYLDNIKLFRTNLEKVSLTGRLDSKYIDNLKAEITEFPLNNLNNFISKETKDVTGELKGTLKKLLLNVNGPMDAPVISCSLDAENVYSNQVLIGNIIGTFDYKQKNITGNLDITNKLADKEKQIIRGVVSKLPIDLSVTNAEPDRFIDKSPIDISLTADDMPLTLISKFIPTVVSNIKGNISGTMNIYGTKSRVEHKGLFSTKNTTLLAVPNNMFYKLYGDVELSTEMMVMKNVTIENNPNDLNGGKATIGGYFTIKDYFAPDEFDLSITTKSLKLLSLESQKNMPSMYGDFILASGTNPIKFTGTLKKPKLTGDAVVKLAKIIMPDIQQKEFMMRGGLKYEFKGKKVVITDKQAKTTDSLKKVKAANIIKTYKEEASFSDILAYDLFVTIPNQMEVTMVLNEFGQIFSVVATDPPNKPIHYIVNPDKKEALLIGDLILKQNSTMNYFKLLNITGNINFPTGLISNPGLNLKAVYNGQSILKGVSRPFQVLITITGTKNTPILKFDYVLDGQSAVGDSSTVSQNALFLLTFGNTKSEYESPGSGRSLDFNDIGLSSLAAVASKSLSDVLQKTGFISNADIDLQGGSFQNARLKLSGQFLGLTWNVGGTVADMMNNNEFSIEIPIGYLIYPEYLQSLFMQISKSINPSQSTSRTLKDWEVKLRLGGSF